MTVSADNLNVPLVNLYDFKYGTMMPLGQGINFQHFSKEGV